MACGMYESIAVVGPTASGKTRRAVSLATELGGEIISADSRQVYRDMTIGTGKDLCEYGDVPAHLIDIREAGEKYNLHQFISDFNNVYAEILGRGKVPVVCGGSGMYVENALNGVRLPEVERNEQLRCALENKTLEELTDILRSYKTLHNTTDVDTVARALRAIEIQEFYKNNPEIAMKADKTAVEPLNALVIGVDIPREKRREKISLRLRQRLDEGMVDEVRMLLERGVSPEDLIYYGLEYKFLTLYLIGKLSYEEMVSQLEIAIHQFAKRQMTWFRGMEKRGWKIHWIPYDLPDNEFVERVKSLMNQ